MLIVKKLLFMFFIFTLTLAYAQQGTFGMPKGKTPIVSIKKVAAYPNPFTTSTKIYFVTTKFQRLKFSVKNLLGKTVYTEEIEAEEGENTIPFYRNSLKKGMYIYTLQSENEVVSKRLVIK